MIPAFFRYIDHMLRVRQVLDMHNSIFPIIKLSIGRAVDIENFQLSACIQGPVRMVER